jgi:histidyl-tRNA synthetase
MPALGFGMGDVVLGELLRARGHMPAGTPSVDFWVAPADAAVRREAVRVASALRERGASVETPLREQSLGKQLKAADVAGARRVVIVGPAFAASQALEVKSLTDGNQRSMSLQELLSQLGEHNRGASDRP